MSAQLTSNTALTAEGKRQLLAELLRKKAQQPKYYPLSFAQQRLWFLDQLEPGSSIYNMPTALRLSGELNIPALEQSLNEVVKRHAILRTVFITAEERPLQLVQTFKASTLTIVDLSDLAAEEREVETKQLLRRERQQPFDLRQGPLWRARLVRLEEREHVLLFTMHHIVSDGWSMEILTREVSVLYTAFTAGRESPLAALPIQYADYSVWQRQWLQGDVLEEQLEYWRAQLAGAPAPLELPTDRARPAQQSYRGASLPLQLSAELTAGLKQLSQREGVTLFMSVLAGWQLLLARYSGQPDVVVGSPIANRTRSEAEGLIGFFVNTLVLRTLVTAELSGRELLQRVREVCLGAYAHQDVPFEMLVEKLQPERERSHTPFFHVMFTLHPAPRRSVAIANQNLILTPMGESSGTAKFDLLLTMNEGNELLGGQIEYDTDLYDRPTISRMVEHLQQLLEGLVANPHQQLRELSLLTEGEQEQLIEWNNTGREYPSEVCINELFERQAQQTPDAVALNFEGRQTTYAELNRRANQLAHYLQSLGVGRETLVGVCVERSIEMVVSYLAILKAGGAYLPLDPSYPQQRLLLMLEDAQPLVVLTEASLIATFSNRSARVLCLDEQWDEVATWSTANPVNNTSADNLAYVMYTSGSTGKPKGVCVPHRAVNQLVLNTDYINLQPSDRIAQASNSSFDAATFEIWGALLHGALLVGLSKDVVVSPEWLSEQLAVQGINVLFLTTALFNEIAREQPQTFAGLKYLLFGGEAVEPKWVKEVSEKGAPANLLHVYGPTENTTFSSWYRVEQVSETATTIPIGHAIANTQTYVLDEQQQLVPVGVPGELYLGGEGLAREYLHSAALTAERFIPHPFSVVAGARLYRTGDVVRRLPQGELEFLGRMDEQVKLRGLRIELGEIESALCEHAAVRKAVVVVREDVAEQRELVGYVVGPEGKTGPSREVQEYLKEQLPDYMVPSKLVWLGELPLTPNGKVDRRALPAPGQTGADAAEEVGSRSPIEELVAGIWREVLHRSELRVGDNFFELGGHSLLATQLLLRLWTVFGLELPLRLLFDAPTVAGQARAIEEALKAGAGVTAPPLLPLADRSRLPLSFAQQRLWFLDQLEPGSTAYNMPTALRLLGPLNVAALERSFTEVVRRHEVLRARIESVAGTPVQVLMAAEAVHLPVVDLRMIAEAERAAIVRQMAVEEAQRVFDLSRGGLLRQTLLRLGAEEHVLLFTMHHIVSDGWSMEILTREVSALYAAYAAGQESTLAALPIQYADYAVWQREWLQGEVLEEQLGYWRATVGGCTGSVGVADGSSATSAAESSWCVFVIAVAGQS